MEEQVKARLIGATVLVVIAVILLPELLSGPRRLAEGGDDAAGKRGTRTYTIDLSGGAGEGKVAASTPPPVESRATAPRLPMVAPPGPAADAQQETPPAVDEPATTVAQGAVTATAEPLVTSPPVARQPAATPVTTEASRTAATATAKPPAPTDAGAAPAAKGAWAVQVGAFGSVETARKLVADLKRDGFAAYIAPLTRSGKTLHRVRVGPQPNRADADRLAARLKSRGLPASVVAAN